MHLTPIGAVNVLPFSLIPYESKSFAHRGVNVFYWSEDPSQEI